MYWKTAHLSIFEPALVKSTATGWSASCCSARARGDARSDSDYDVAVFLLDLGDLTDPRELAARDAEMSRLADLSTAILYQSGEFIHAMPYPARSYNDRTPLMHEIRAEGIDL